MSELKISNISISFGDNKILDDISFELANNEKICILGASGSGKSTLLKIIAGLFQSDSGMIELNTMSIPAYNDSVPPEDRPMNMVFQNYALWPHMTVRDNIIFGLKLNKVPKKEIEKRLNRFVKMLQIGELLGRMPAELSGGQQQRVGIARAISSLPKILLMDEPLSNLDVKLRSEMRSELSVILKELQTSTLYVTHDVLEAFAIADRILVLDKGKIVQLDTPENVYEEPLTLQVAHLMGYQNLFTGKVAGKNQRSIEFMVGDQVIESLTKENVSVNSEMNVMVQQDALEIIERSAHKRDAYNFLPAEILNVIYEGNRFKYRLLLENDQGLDCYSTTKFEENAQVQLSFKIERTKAFL